MDKFEELQKLKSLLDQEIITQEEFRGAFVVEHIRGSQYLIRLVDGTEVFASHKKQKEAFGGVSKGGWKLWEDRR